MKRTGLRAAPIRESTTELFISRLDPYITARELREHFDSLNIHGVEIEAIDTKYDSYTSFTIKVPIKSPNVWPERVYIIIRRHYPPQGLKYIIIDLRIVSFNCKGIKSHTAEA